MSLLCTSSRFFECRRGGDSRDLTGAAVEKSLSPGGPTALRGGVELKGFLGPCAQAHGRGLCPQGHGPRN